MSAAPAPRRATVTAYAEWKQDGSSWSARIGRTECTIRLNGDAVSLVMSRPGHYDRSVHPTVHAAQVHALENAQ